MNDMNDTTGGSRVSRVSGDGCDGLPPARQRMTQYDRDMWWESLTSERRYAEDTTETETAFD